MIWCLILCPNNDVFTFFKRKKSVMSALTSLTLKQLASGVVVREDLPIKDLPNPLKRELEALAMLPGNYTIIGESKELGKCGGGKLTRDEVVRVNGSFEEGKKKCALMGDVGQRIKVTAESWVGWYPFRTPSGAEKLKRFAVERRGEDKARNKFDLKKKVFEDCKRQKGGKFRTFVNNGSLKSDYHVPTRPGKAEKLLKLSMFIDQKGKLVMLNSVQRKGLVWSSRTTAQRD